MSEITTDSKRYFSIVILSANVNPYSFNNRNVNWNNYQSKLATEQQNHYVNYSTLHKIPQFHLISWCGNFIERNSFRKSPKFMPKFCLSTNFHTRKLQEITVFYAVQLIQAFKEQIRYFILSF